MRSSRIVDILDSVKALQEPVHLHGSSRAAGALLLARYVNSTSEPVVVFCADDDLAEELASEIETLSNAIEGRPLDAWVFPGWEQSPYNTTAPSIRTRLSRTALLTALSEPGRVRLIVTSLRAFSQATIPAATLAALQLRVERDKTLPSRDELAHRLSEAGFLRVETVEDPGTFAVRGEIIDIYPPDRPRPVRVELFGDSVERIRDFDPKSQRALSTDSGSAQLLIGPAREVLINRDTAARVREQLKARADDTGIPKAARDPVLASVRDGLYPEHSDTWAPFAYETPATLWDHLPKESRFVWCDSTACEQEWDKFIIEQRKRAGEAPASEVIAPPAEELFRWNTGLEKQVKAASRLYVDQVALTGLADIEATREEGEKPSGPTAQHRVIVQGNQDLARGSRQSLGELEPKFKNWLKEGFHVVALAATQSQLERIRFLLEERGHSCTREGPLLASTIALRIGSLSEGFRWPAEGLVVLTEGEILGSRPVRKARRKTSDSGSAAKDWAGLSALSDLSVGDAVVHIDHGIGRYHGLARLDLAGAPMDFLVLEYANKDKLYLPVYRLNVIQKYVGSGEGAVLDRLGSQQFAKTKEKVRDAVKTLAIDLVKLYAERKIRPGVAFSPRDSMFREFEAKFPFEETPDQLKAIDDSLADMESGRAMDRLVCGDVGYGKTEVAIRAAFRAVSDGKQVVVLVPTTILAYQHELSFKARLKDYPVTVESLSRFKSPKEQKAILEALADGKLDIVIGTHRLLSRDVRFRDLGLIIVDEEHRFGVEHKERLKTLRVNTHVLTLSATPIPRTLHMALAGLRDISLINTPPVDRLPIRTYVSKYDETLIQRAIEVELQRGGQVFFLHNRVQSIHETAARIRELVKDAAVAVAHGQMAEKDLARTMLDFYHKRSNVLVCTSIIESGLDLPSANTLIVDRADTLGLAQLYQIRGRVGRGQARAYAYLLIPAEGAVSEDARKRLEVIQRFVELGSGFSIASHDLEIRGGGDLLGPQQSGHIEAVGFDLYTELLEEAIHDLQGQPPSPEESRREPEIKTPFAAYLAEEYVPDVHQRLSLYRRFSGAEKEGELERLEEELVDRFGPLPVEAQNLLWMIRLKQLLKRSGIDALTVGPQRISLVPGPASKLDPTRAIALVSSKPDDYQLTPDSKFVARLASGSLRDLYFGAEALLQSLSKA